MTELKPCQCQQDVQKTKHGKWLINCDGYYPYCSECGNEPQGRAMTDYCPNCGAKMTVAEEEAKNDRTKS